MRRIVLDTDIGTDVDDTLALLLACKSPELRIEAITVVGSDVGRSARLALKTLQVAGAKDIPVAEGMDRPLIRNRGTWGAYGGHGVDISGRDLVPGKVHAVDLLVSLFSSAKRDLDLITIGPLTNVAAAMIREPSIASKIGHLFIMGGIVGRETPSMTLQEYNFACDPEATNVVLGSSAQKTVVGLDVTLKVPLTAKYLQRLRRAGTDVASYAYGVARHYQRNIAHASYNYLHDPLTIGASVDRSLLKTVGMKVRVETRGDLTEGWTVSRLPGGDEEPDAEVALGVESEKFLEMFTRRLCRRA
jgi:purine nucleosidase